MITRSHYPGESVLPTVPILTAQTLRHLLTCPRRVWLDMHGNPTERDEVSPETQWLYTLGIQHEQAVQQATADSIEALPVSSWAEGVAVTRELMATGAPVIIGAYLAQRAPLDLSGNEFELRGRVDRLVRLRRFGESAYAPVEIKRRSQPDTADWVQLDYYAWLLSFVQASTPPGELWLGADELGRPRRRLPHEFDEERLLAVLAQAASILAAPTAPAIHLESHCRACPWYTACQAAARAEGHLDLLYNLPRTTRDHLRQAGVATLADVVARPPTDLQRVKGIGAKRARTLQANAQALLSGEPVWLAALPDLCRQPGWMFDLETCEVKGQTVPWCMGWCDVNGRTEIALVATVQLTESLMLPGGQRVILVPDSDSAWEAFAAAVAVTDAPIYHWSGYDAALLRQSAPAPVRTSLEPRLHDLNATLRRSVSLPLKSTSIKQVSTFLGFAWPGHQDYRAAYVDYRYWLESGDPTVLARACTYQRADVQSLAHVWHWMNETSPPPDTKPRAAE